MVSSAVGVTFAMILVNGALVMVPIMLGILFSGGVSRMMQNYDNSIGFFDSLLNRNRFNFKKKKKRRRKYRVNMTPPSTSTYDEYYNNRRTELASSEFREIAGDGDYYEEDPEYFETDDNCMYFTYLTEIL